MHGAHPMQATSPSSAPANPLHTVSTHTPLLVPLLQGKVRKPQFGVKKTKWKMVYEYVSRIMCAANRGIPQHVRKGTTSKHRIVVSHLAKCQGKMKECAHPGHLKWCKKKWDVKDAHDWHRRKNRRQMDALLRPTYPLSTAIRGFPRDRSEEERAKLHSQRKSPAARQARSQRSPTPEEEDPFGHVVYQDDGSEDSAGGSLHSEDTGGSDEGEGEEAGAAEAGGMEGHPFVDDAAEGPKPARRPRHVRVRPQYTVKIHEASVGFMGSSLWKLLRKHAPDKLPEGIERLESEEERRKDQAEMEAMQRHEEGKKRRRRPAATMMGTEEGDDKADEDADDERDGEGEEGEEDDDEAEEGEEGEDEQDDEDQGEASGEEGSG